MSGDWLVVLAAALPVLVLLGFGVVVGRIRGGEEDSLGADPEDRPLPAVVANPTKLEPDTRRQITTVCAALGWAEPLWLETTVDDPGTGQRGPRRDVDARTLGDDAVAGHRRSMAVPRPTVQNATPSLRKGALQCRKVVCRPQSAEIPRGETA